MNVLVSDTTNSYSDWVVVRNLSDVNEIVGNIDYLVYHKSKESPEGKIKVLSKIGRDRTDCKIIYVCCKEKVDNAIKMLVTGGLNGKYVDDEFFLESEQELNNMVSDLHNIVTSTELSCSSVLNDFFNRYLSEGAEGVSKGYLKVVKNAALEMSESYYEKNKEILEMSESAAEIFSSSVDIISQMREQTSSLEKDLRTLRDKNNMLDAFSMNNSSVNSSILYYPKVKYMKSKLIFRFKDLGRTPFLVSFLLGFREFLDRIKSVRPKMIVIEGNGKLLEDRYKDYNWVTNTNKTDNRHFYNNIVFTNCPTSMVLSKLLDDNSYDTFIILDRTINYKENVLDCKGTNLFVVNGKSQIDENKLQKNNCISSIKYIEGVLVNIPYFEDYPDRDDQRINLYLKECASVYETIYSKKVL